MVPSWFSTPNTIKNVQNINPAKTDEFEREQIEGFGMELKCLKLSTRNYNYFCGVHMVTAQFQVCSSVVRVIASQAWTGPQGFRNLKLPEFLNHRHMKVARLSTVHTGRFTTPSPGDISGTYFSQRLSLPQGHIAARRIKSMINPNDLIGSRTRDLSACSITSGKRVLLASGGSTLECQLGMCSIFLKFLVFHRIHR